MHDRSPRDDALVGLLMRLPTPDYQRLKRLSSRTRIRQSELLREALSDLLAKYDHLP